MPFVSIIVEFLRARPRGVFWTAMLAQTALWLLVPTFFYASPPGALPETLAIGREWQLGSAYGPPLAYWLAEAAFRLAGANIVGVYVLAQICVGVSFWLVFRLCGAIAGLHHAALAVLLMAGVLVLSFPTPEFGPAILSMPLTAAALLLFWRAVGERHRNYWLAVGAVLGLLLLTTYWALLLIALFAVYLVATPEGRATLRLIDPYAALALALLIPFPHFVWAFDTGPIGAFGIYANERLAGRLAWWPVLLVVAVAVHVGLIVLALVSSRLGLPATTEAPQIGGPAVSASARRYVFFFATAPVLAGTIVTALIGVAADPAWLAPAVLMSGAAVVVVAGRRISLHRQYVVGSVWVALLLTPPVAAVAAIYAVPWTIATELSTQQPAAAMARFFAETYRRRTGQPLEMIAGDRDLAEIIAAASPSRPRVFAADQPGRTPWIAEDDVLQQGAVIVWRFRDATGQPPRAFLERFPEMVPEVPQTFARPVQGFLPTYRVGWALIRPAAEPPAQ